MPLVVGLFRQASYSPHQHRANDTAILERTLDHFARDGWAVAHIDESALANAWLARATHTPLPPAALYLSMCQGEAASQALLAFEASADVTLVNRPSSVLACHRHRLVPALAARGVRFPRTEIVDAADADLASSVVVRDAAATDSPVWVKRGDVHAERDEDVVRVDAAGVREVVAAFAARGVRRVALQAHVPGPVLKFYGVADGRFFRWYRSDDPAHGTGPSSGQARIDVDEPRLRALAFGAAAALGLDVFGGDVALPSRDDPVLIDLNDWPSFAPFRDDAARAIADYARDVVAHARPTLETLDALDADVA